MRLLVPFLIGVAGCSVAASPPGGPCDAASPPTVTAVEVPPVAPTPTDAVEDACRAGDVEACEEMFARYRLGQGVEASEGRARSFFQRAAELRIARCARGEAEHCRHLPQNTHPLALTPAERPPVGAEHRMEGASVLVTVEAQGQVLLDGTPMKDVSRELRRACESGARASIAADAQVRYQRVVGILDELKQAGCTRITFVVAAP